MKVIRTTVVTPKAGYEQEVAAVLAELGEYVAKQPGFVEAYAYQEDGKLTRISVWAKREDADRAANHIHTIALRAKLHALTLPDRVERLVEIRSEQHAGNTAVAA